MSEARLVERLSPILNEAKRHAVVIRGGDEDLGAVISMENYEIVRRAKAEKFLAASADYGEYLRERAAEQGLTVDDLLRLLDRKSSYALNRADYLAQAR